jgi:hypothetical protein
VKTDTVYLVCFAPGISRGGMRGNSEHYLGSCQGDPERRLGDHIKGKGSPLVRAAHQRGLNPRVTLQFPGDRRVERAIKDRKFALRKLCPVCQGVSQ